ncbi:MAG TPA: tetratricopeptide repeat protein, partial [Planctomycetota bacterium]|nr:tetratricopeptide repeat protein [Planctomycetota bacterium]
MVISIFSLVLLLAPAVASPVAPATALTAQEQSVDELLALGRKALLDGNVEEAMRQFSEAEKKDGASLRTHAFVLRAMIGQDRVEDALAEVDELKKANPTSIELDYLYGTGFYALAARDMASGKTTSITGSQFEDAVQFLKKVTAKNEPRFADAWTTLADAAWYTQDFELGAHAAEKAAEISPANPASHFLHGRLALAAHAAWKSDQDKVDAAEDQWQAAVAAFEKAIALCGAEPEAKLRPLAQQAWMQLATTFLWKEMRPDAVAAFARAIALEPTTADFGAISTALAGQEFLDTLEAARKKLGGANEATILWWIGYAHYGQKQLAEAEKTFESALAKNPEFWTSLYYLFRIRFEQREFAKCLETLHRYPPVDPSGAAIPYHGNPAADATPDRGGLVPSLAYDVAGNVARLEGLIGWATESKNHGGKTLNLEAAFACDLITRIVPREPEYSRHWNNLGLFLRDEGDELRGTQGALEPPRKKCDEAWINKLWEASYK